MTLLPNTRTKTKKKETKSWAYEFHGTASAFNDQISHVANQVGSEAEVEEHVEDDEDHLSGVDGVHVAIADRGHGGYGPVKGGDVADPEAGFPEVRDH